MTFQTKFPDYPVSDMPELPEGFEDNSWHNNAAPSIQNLKLGLHIWMDYAEPSQREIDGGSRFTVMEIDAEGAFLSDKAILETDNWNEVLTFIARHEFQDVLDQLAANDGAILYWQTGVRFKAALDAGVIRMVGDLLVHPDATEIESGMAYTMNATA